MDTHQWQYMAHTNIKLTIFYSVTTHSDMTIYSAKVHGLLLELLWSSKIGKKSSKIGK